MHAPRSRLTLLGSTLRLLLGCAALSPLLGHGQTDPQANSSPAAKTVEEVLVTGDGSQVLLLETYPGGQVARGGRAGILGNLDMMDAPFASSNFTNALIRDQQADSVADVLQNDPMVRVATGFGNFQELYIIRGFPVYSDDMTYNGLYGILPRQFVAAELLERVEVFRGANSFLNGASPGGSGVGGLVNLVPKRAPEEDLNLLTAGFESGGQRYLALDTARRLGSSRESGVRVNLLRREGDTAINEQERELSVLALGLDHQGERLRLSADIGYQDQRVDAPRPSVTPLGAIPKPPEADSNFAQPWTYTDEKQLFGVARAEYDLSDNSSAWLAIGGRQGEEDNVLSNPDARADGSGDTSATRFDNVREDRIYSAETGLRSEFATGHIDHRVIVSASVFSLESKNAYAFSDFAGFAGNLYQPQAVAPPPATAFVGGDLNDPGVTQETDTSSLAIADMLSFMQGRLLITLGARYQKIENQSFDYNSGAPLANSDYSESAVTPVAGMVYKIRDSLSVYGNYSEALLPGEIAPATSGGDPVSNAGEAFDPYRSEQWELGVKYDGGEVGATASVFSTDKPLSIVENGRFSDNGEQRNRGLELSLFGQPASHIRLLGGLTWLDAEQTNTANDSGNGKDAVGVPDWQANVNVEWDPASLPGVTLDLRAIHTAEQYANAANTVKVDSWSRIDAGVRYQLPLGQRELSLRGRVVNLTDDDYWASVGGFPGSNYLVLGAPRSLIFSASIDF